ncbi:MAG: hydantoinase/oxoprolinase N-terminal domain-containing protein [Rickettsiales bacterium]
MAWRIGVDIGGTFTDAALVDEATGAIGIAKTLTTPRDFGAGVVNALTEAIDAYDLPPRSSPTPSWRKRGQERR